MFTQCNYCKYTTTADEYGVINAPYHLMTEHGIGENADGTAMRDFENHFHMIETMRSPWESIYYSILKQRESLGMDFDQVNELADTIYKDIKDRGYLFYIKVDSGEVEEW
jgi:hypothetical protein